MKCHESIIGNVGAVVVGAAGAAAVVVVVVGAAAAAPPPPYGVCLVLLVVVGGYGVMCGISYAVWHRHLLLAMLIHRLVLSKTAILVNRVANPFSSDRRYDASRISVHSSRLELTSDDVQCNVEIDNSRHVGQLPSHDQANSHLDSVAKSEATAAAAVVWNPTLLLLTTTTEQILPCSPRVQLLMMGLGACHF